MNDAKLLLIDLSALFWRAWHANAAKPVNDALLIVLNTIARLATGRTYVAICCDAPPYKRREMFPEYKAHRPETDEGARAQLRDLQARLETDGRLLWSVKGFEADDVIATATKLARSLSPPIEVEIATLDKDLTQLVGDGVSLLDPRDGKLSVAADIVAKWGVEPSQMGDLLALMGDSGDNIPGVDGVAKVRAKDLLVIHKSIAGIVDAIPAMKDGAIKAALAGAVATGSLDLSRKLVALVDDLPIDIAAVFEKRDAKPLPTQERARRSPPVVVEPIEESAPSTALAVRGSTAVASPDWTLALEPRTADEAWTVAGDIASSRLFGLSTQSQVFTAIMLGRVHGIDAVTMVRGCHVIDGKLALHASMIVALVLRSRKADFFRLVASTDKIATYRTHRRDDPDPEPVEMSFTIEMANRRGLSGKKNWREMPEDMLRHRAAVSLARAVFPDVAMGCYSPDELSGGASEIVDAEIEATKEAAA